MFNCENVDVIGLGEAEVVADEPEEPEDEMPFPVWCRPANEVPTKEFWPKDWLNCDRPLKKEKKTIHFCYNHHLLYFWNMKTPVLVFFYVLLVISRLV